MPDDFLNTTSTTGRLSVGGTSSGNIEISGDTDWFRISLVAGQTYQFDLRGSPSGNGTLSDPYMSLRNSSGSSTRLAQDDNAGTGYDSRFTYTAMTTGYHFVAAGSSVGGIGTYQVAASNPVVIHFLPEVTVLGNAVSIADGDTTPVTTDNTNFGSVAVGSAGVVRMFTVRNDGNATLNLSSLTLPTGFTLANSNGLVTSLAPGATDTFDVRMDATTAGTKTGQITFVSNDPNESPFNFTITGTVTGITTDAGNTRATATALKLGNPVSQSVGVSPDSDDYFSFTATESGRVVAALTGLSANINLLALNSGGTPIAVSQRTGNAAETLSFNVVADQTYFLQADPDGAVFSNYQLTTGYWTEAVGVALPIRIPAVVTQGYRGDSSHSIPSIQWAVDFDLAIGDDVFAVSAGTVVGIRSNSTGRGDLGGGWLGNFVTVLHDGGFYATYAHLSAVSVSVGQRVSSSTMLGDGGNTGYIITSGGDGSHLHLHFGTQTKTTPDGFLIATGENDSFPPAFFTAFATQAEVAGLVNPSSSASIQVGDIFGSASAPLINDNDELSGTPGNNRIFGLSGRDRLSGNGGNDSLVGGSGNDILTGGAGTDTFVFSTALGAANIDTITDFFAIDDTIRLSRAIFTTAGPLGQLAINAFALNTTGLATDEFDRVIYNSTTGALFYDSNGNAADGSNQFATLSAGLALTSADFFLF